MKSETFNRIINAVTAICAVVIVGVLLRREFAPSRSVQRPTTKVANWRDYVGGNAVTTSDGSVSVIVFSDYECPACRKLARTVDSLAQARSLGATVLYRNLPIAIHRRARPAAYAAGCAARHGRFAAAHALLFGQVDSIGVRPWDRFALVAGLADTGSFASCVRDSLPASEIAEDEAAARRLGVRVTPTVLINDTMVEGVPAASELVGLIRNAAKAAKGAK